jgi:hypothetical protein
VSSLVVESRILWYFNICTYLYACLFFSLHRIFWEIYSERQRKSMTFPRTNWLSTLTQWWELLVRDGDFILPLPFLILFHPIQCPCVPHPLSLEQSFKVRGREWEREVCAKHYTYKNSIFSLPSPFDSWCNWTFPFQVSMSGSWNWISLDWNSICSLTSQMLREIGSELQSSFILLL